MDFYMMVYKRQLLKEGIWVDTDYQNQKIVVIAASHDEAREKIEYCLKKVESGTYRAVQINNIIKCVGLDLRYGFEDSFYISKIE